MCVRVVMSLWWCKVCLLYLLHKILGGFVRVTQMGAMWIGCENCDGGEGIHESLFQSCWEREREKEERERGTRVCIKCIL